MMAAARPRQQSGGALIYAIPSREELLTVPRAWETRHLVSLAPDPAASYRCPSANRIARRFQGRW